MEDLHATVNHEPFPHMLVEDFYNDDELKLIWEELNFYTKDGKLFDAEGYGGIPNKTNSKAIQLDALYRGKYRKISNILAVNRKVFDKNVLDAFSDIHDCCNIARWCNHDINAMIQLLSTSVFVCEDERMDINDFVAALRCWAHGK